MRLHISTTWHFKFKILNPPWNMYTIVDLKHPYVYPTLEYIPAKHHSSYWHLPRQVWQLVRRPWKEFLKIWNYLEVKNQRLEKNSKISKLTWPPCQPSLPFIGNMPAKWISFGDDASDPLKPKATIRNKARKRSWDIILKPKNSSNPLEKKVACTTTTIHCSLVTEAVWPHKWRPVWAKLVLQSKQHRA